VIGALAAFGLALIVTGVLVGIPQAKKQSESESEWN
jgi:hypothetical protein